MGPIEEIPNKYLLVSEPKGVYTAPNPQSLLLNQNRISSDVWQDINHQQLQHFGPGKTGIPLTPPPMSTRKVTDTNQRIRSYSLSHKFTAPSQDQQQHHHASHQQHFQSHIVRGGASGSGAGGGGVATSLNPTYRQQLSNMLVATEFATAAAIRSAGGPGAAGAGAGAMALNVASSAPTQGSQLIQAHTHTHTGHGGRRRTTSSNSNG